MKITHFDRAACKMLTPRVQQALQDHFGDLTVKTGAIKFNATSMTIQVTFETDGAAEVQERNVAFACELHDVAKTSVPGYEIVDYRDRSPKYPFIVEHDGSKWKYSPEQARRTFGRVQEDA